MTASFDRPAQPESGPSAWVERWLPLVSPGGHVLDVAAGHGRHSRLALARGHAVTAVDIDLSGLSGLDGVRAVEADLEGARWPFGPERFDAIIVTNYLHRPLFKPIAHALAPGGVLIWETFGEGNAAYGRPRNPAFLLKPGELLRAFDRRLTILAYEHGVEQLPRPAVRQRLCAINVPAPGPLAPLAGA